LVADHLPKSRLNQIAQRKLSSLRIVTKLVDEGQTLEGQIVLPRGQLTNLLDKQPIERIRFRAEGHDKMRFLEPPLLAELPPLPFYEHGTVGAIVLAIERDIKRRVAALQQMVRDLKPIITFEVDTARAMLMATIRLEAGGGSAALEADDRGLYLVSITPLEGREVPVERKLIDRKHLSSRVELELYLAHLAGEAKKAMDAAPERKPRLGSGAMMQLRAPTEKSAAAGPMTLRWLTQLLGGDAALSGGIEITRELTVNGRRMLFEAHHVADHTFKVDVSEGERSLFDGELDLARFPGLEPFAKSLLMGKPMTRLDAAESEPELSGDIVLHDMLPKVGELWTMNVLIEQEDEREVRYVPLNTDGRPYGAARVLPREHFTSVFESKESGWTLAVRVVRCDSKHNVTYRRVDREMRSIGQEQTMALIGFLSQFVQAQSAD
jgi:hypothetical protein